MQRQHASFIVDLGVNTHGSIWWQQKNHSLRSIFTMNEKRGSFMNRTVLKDKKQTSVPELHKLPQFAFYLGAKPSWNHNFMEEKHVTPQKILSLVDWTEVHVLR